MLSLTRSVVGAAPFALTGKDVVTDPPVEQHQFLIYGCGGPNL